MGITIMVFSFVANQTSSRLHVTHKIELIAFYDDSIIIEFMLGINFSSKVNLSKIY